MYISEFVSSLFSTVFIIFLIISLGYLIGAIQIRGISLGTAGVLVMALIFGIFSSFTPYFCIGGKNVVLFLSNSMTLADGTVLAANKSLFSLVSSFGTVMFVSAVGLLAGRDFFRTINRKSLVYVLMGTIIIAIGSVISILIINISKDPNVDASLVTGLMTGALTSTPGLAAAKEIALDESKCTAGYSIGYLFGVLGVVLFVQILPRLLKVDIEEEKKAFQKTVTFEADNSQRRWIRPDRYGMAAFSATVVFGTIIGNLKIPGIEFSLGSSGGTLIAGLIIGHFGHIGALDCDISKNTLRIFQEMGLCLFLVGAGVPGGANFISNVRVMYFVYGIIITTVPMILGYLIGRYIFCLSLYNNLGSITGGMTSTPALGALIESSGIDDVVGPYAATYPFALFFVVLASRIIAGVL